MLTMKFPSATVLATSILFAYHSMPTNCDTFSATANLLSLSLNESKVIKETQVLFNELKSITSKLER